MKVTISASEMLGLDPIKNAGASICGFLVTFKAPGMFKALMIYSSLIEMYLALHHEYDPRVRTYQRADPRADVVEKWGLVGTEPMPFGLNYVFNDEPHVYYPDYVGRLDDGRLFISEAGVAARKAKPQEQAKAAVARRLVEIDGGRFQIATEDHVWSRRHWNWIFLHTRRTEFRKFREIADFLQPVMVGGAAFSVRRLVHECQKKCRDRWKPPEVEAAAWRVAAEAAASGHLLVDLDKEQLSLDTLIRISDPREPAVLPPDLPSAIEPRAQSDLHTLANSMELVDEESSEEDSGFLAGAPFDPNGLSQAERVLFDRNLNAVTELSVSGKPTAVAAKYGISMSTLRRLKDRVKKYGEIGCVPGIHLGYKRDPKLHSALVKKIAELYGSDNRPGPKEIMLHPEIRKEARRLTRETGQLVLGPTLRQVGYLTRKLAKGPRMREKRSGQKHRIPALRLTLDSMRMRVPYAGGIAVVDEHDVDSMVTTAEGVVIRQKIHVGGMIDLLTNAPMSENMCLNALSTEDYMHMIGRATESKKDLTTEAGCVNKWDVACVPMIVLSDRGKIFISFRAVHVLVLRLGCIMAIAPPNSPLVKFPIEGLWSWTADEFAHPLPNSTFSNPEKRGTYDTVKEAEKAGITLPIEELAYRRSLVDVFYQDWDNDRNQTRANLWFHATAKTGVRTFLGSKDDLRITLMDAVAVRSFNPRKLSGNYPLDRHGISFRNHWYVLTKDITDRVAIGDELELFQSDYDQGVIYLKHKGQFLCIGICSRLKGRRVSRAELKAARDATKPERDAVKKATQQTQTDIREDLSRGRRAMKQKDVKIAENSRLNDQKIDMFRTDEAQAFCKMLSESAVDDQIEATHEQSDERESLEPAVRRPRVLPFPVREPVFHRGQSHRGMAQNE